MFDAVVVVGPGYKAPTFAELRGPFLQDEKTECTARLVEFRASWEHARCTVMSDGWTNVARSGSEAEARSGSAERGSVIFQKSRKRSVRGSVCYIYIYILYFFAFILKTNIPNTKLIVEDMKTCIFLHKSR